jgi:murein peptide amidase A
MGRIVTKIPHWAYSANRNPIALFASEPLAKLKNLKPIILAGGIHGDEPEGVRLAEDTLNWLINDSLPLTLNPWIVIPCINPDGFQKNERTNGNGVDLNRNYPSKNWSADYSALRYFPGKYPGSETEVQAFVTLILAMQPSLVIHCHSWNPCVVYTGQPAEIPAQILAKCSGYPANNTIGYPTPGSLSQWGWHDNQVPIICIEAQEKVDLETVWPKFGDGLQQIFTSEQH